MVPLPTPFAPLGETPKERNARREQLLEHSAFFAEAVCAKIGSKTHPFQGHIRACARTRAVAT